MSVISRWLAGCGLCIWTTISVFAQDDAAAALQAQLQHLDQFEARFEQYVHDEGGALIEFSTGFVVLDAKRFRWQVDEPFPQVIVSDGETVQIYDPDLEQVTERELSEALAGTPLGVMTNGDADLSQDYVVVTLPSESERYALRSLAPDSPYQNISLSFDTEASLQEVEVIDHFGQRLRVRFLPLEDGLPAAPFTLELPESVQRVRG